MKKVLLFVLLICFTANIAESADIKRYKIKSGIIEYKIDGMTKGTETVYFDDWGIREAKFTKTITKVLGFKVESSTLTINDKDWSYTIDLKEKTGTKTSNKQFKKMFESMSEKDWERYGEKVMEELDAVRIGNETLLGKSCEVWDIRKLNSKTWSYQYVPLKTEINLMGQTTYIATKFEENANVPADKFQVPKGIKITEQEMPEDMPDNIFDIFQKAIDEQDQEND